MTFESTFQNLTNYLYADILHDILRQPFRKNYEDTVWQSDTDIASINFVRDTLKWPTKTAYARNQYATQ